MLYEVITRAIHGSTDAYTSVSGTVQMHVWDTFTLWAETSPGCTHADVKIYYHNTFLTWVESYSGTFPPYGHYDGAVDLVAFTVYGYATPSHPMYSANAGISW